jgi:hypothetical protein
VTGSARINDFQTGNAQSLSSVRELPQQVPVVISGHFYCDGGSRARAMLVKHASSDGAAVPSLHSTLTGATSAACFGAGVAEGGGAGDAACWKRAQPRSSRKTSKTRLLRIGLASAFSYVQAVGREVVETG